jgi:ferritin-like metal-binding protein YciE
VTWRPEKRAAFFDIRVEKPVADIARRLGKGCAGLLAAAQAVEHYEISRYGTLKTWAQELGLEEAVELLDTTLAEEKKTDEVLTEIAESSVNQHAEAA